MMLIELSNGMRLWGVMAVILAVPAITLFFRFALRRAFDNCEGVDGHVACAMAFARGAWRAGNETPLRLNTWAAIAMMAFVGLGGAAIFVSSNFLGGYSSGALNLVMLPLWSMLSFAAWIFTVQTSHRPRGKIIAAILLLAVVLAIATSLNGKA